MKNHLSILAVAALLTCATGARANLTWAGPFTGTSSESFEEFNNYEQGPFYLGEPTSIFGGLATISSQNQDMAVYQPDVGADYGLGSAEAGVADGEKALGLNSSNDVATITFNSPINAFGGYFGAAFGYGYPATVDFGFSGGETASFTYGNESGNLTWQGWTSDVGITQVTISGTYIVFDALQANSSGSVPDTGSTLILLGVGLIAVVLSRRFWTKAAAL